MSYSIQSVKSREQNKLYSIDTSIHDWYRFVLSFPPHLVRKWIERFDIQTDQTVLDPFCGTGTTVVESKKLGIPSYGIEANPIAHLASLTKSSWQINTKELLTVAHKIYENVQYKISLMGNNLLFLPEEKEKLIIKNSINPLPLHKSLILIEEIEKAKSTPSYNYLRLAFAKQLVFSFSNLHFGPEVGVSRKKRTDADVATLWLSQIRLIAHDIDFHFENRNVDSTILNGDSRTQVPHCLIDAVITSPPYPNEKDYTRTTRLESVLLGFINTKQELRNYKEKLLRSNTRNVFQSDTDDNFIKYNQRILKLSEKIENRRIELNKTSGFERNYHKVVQLYFGGMYQHLSTLRVSLRKGARLAYVVGDQASYFQVLIRTSEIIAEIAEYLGYRVDGIETFRTRLSTATKQYLNEDIVILTYT